MRTIGSLLLLLAVGLFVYVGINGFDDMSNQASASNDSHIVSQTVGVNTTLSPVLYIFGFIILIIGATIAIDAYR
jgi:hypothetical protein